MHRQTAVRPPFFKKVTKGTTTASGAEVDETFIAPMRALFPTLVNYAADWVLNNALESFNWAQVGRSRWVSDLVLDGSNLWGNPTDTELIKKRS